MQTVDEIAQVERWNIEQIVRLFKQFKIDHDTFDAVVLTDDKIDYHDLENLLLSGCEYSTAVEILR